MSHAPQRRPKARPPNVHADALRDAGIRVTSTRLLTLRLAESVLARHGRLSPKLLRAAALENGYPHLSASTFYGTLPALAAAGLVPAGALTSSRKASAAAVPPSPAAKPDP